MLVHNLGASDGAAIISRLASFDEVSEIKGLEYVHIMAQEGNLKHKSYLCDVEEVDFWYLENYDDIEDYFRGDNFML